ncbi:hypothetical protein Nepgr_013690 [Nepenthes gracilis]|uniref:Ubiquitin-activating enzyme SCCH domain-containing protein n=1 Tax=Nepenthes gracilis TaxID=150966 RepID=A0AAD3XPE6_NEPGR|nr:hypothetical protein Nepgr_013690 [Nepenthes gracilis]
MDGERLEFQDGDLVVFSEVIGMTKLNDRKPQKIKNARPYSFTLDENTTNYGRDTLERVIEWRDKERCETFQDCITWAHLKFEDYFVNRVKQLTFTFPKDAVTSSGTQLWSASKHFPCPLQLLAVDLSHLNFVGATSMLRPDTWLAAFPGELQKPSAKSLYSIVAREICGDSMPMYPPPSSIFNALNSTLFDKV